LEIAHRFIETNGINMHLATAGEGPLVLLCHGWPESWYSWRHQLKALAEAGYCVVAPDMRGYGQTDKPAGIDQYTLFHLAGDMVGVVDALGYSDSVIIGHDWGAPVAWHSALFRPDKFKAVVGLSVPFRPRSDVRPTSAMPQTDDAIFYQLYFQKPGVAEAELERNVRHSLRTTLFGGFTNPEGDSTSVGMIPRVGAG
jgi:pimeloyl-ACP methyl ester carboxylesterase